MLAYRPFTARFWFDMRFRVAIFLCCSAGLAAAIDEPVGNTTSATVALPSSNVDSRSQFLVRDKVPANVGIEQIAKESAAFAQPLDAAKFYKTDKDHVLWLRVSLQQPETPAAGDDNLGLSQSYTLDVADSMVNRIDVFHQDSMGRWQKQSAGRLVAQKLWRERGLYPRFNLPVLRPGIHEFYVRVEQRVPAC